MRMIEHARRRSGDRRDRRRPARQTVGKGDGRTAATVAGAVAGGFAGNAVEANNNGRPYNAYRFYVQLDDGRKAVVTQYDNPGFRPGDRVMIRNSHLVMLR